MRILNLLEKDWQEKAYPEMIAVLPFTPEQMIKRFGINFIEYNEDGIGLFLGSYVEIADVQCSLSALANSTDFEGHVALRIPSTTEDSDASLKNILIELGINENEILWRAPDLGPRRFSVCRLDDNGNEFEIERFLNHHSAVAVCQDYTSKGHKQLYTVKILE